MKKIIYCLIGLTLMLSTTSCVSDPNSPGLEYMPDMYRSPAVEYYGNQPVAPEGTIPVHHRDIEEILYTKEVVAHGEELYNVFCIVCHGPEGKGNGTVPATGKYPPPPAYKNLSSDYIYQISTEGKNSMGAYKYLLTNEERWHIVAYIQTIQVRS